MPKDTQESAVERFARRNLAAAQVIATSDSSLEQFVRASGNDRLADKLSKLAAARRGADQQFFKVFDRLTETDLVESKGLRRAMLKQGDR